MEDVRLRHIIHQCQSFNKEAQKELYKEFYSYGMSMCMRYAEDREMAISVLNDSFMKVFENIKKYNPKYPFKGWFRRILINQSINAIRRKSGSFRESYYENINPAQQAEQITTGISHKEIVGFIQQLTPAYRTVFNLYVIEGYSHVEIAKMLGTSTGTSKSNLSKAKEKLRIILNNHFEVDEQIRRR